MCVSKTQQRLRKGEIKREMRLAVNNTKTIGSVRRDVLCSCFVFAWALSKRRCLYDANVIPPSKHFEMLLSSVDHLMSLPSERDVFFV